MIKGLADKLVEESKAKQKTIQEISLKLSEAEKEREEARNDYQKKVEEFSFRVQGAKENTVAKEVYDQVVKKL
jgi:hypothetical protein